MAYFPSVGSFGTSAYLAPQKSVGNDANDVWLVLSISWSELVMKLIALEKLLRNVLSKESNRGYDKFAGSLKGQKRRATS